MTRQSLAALMLLGTAAAVTATPADAQGRFAARMFDAVDTDADGRVTQAEMDEARARRFDRLDADDDGVISQGEMDEARARAQRRLERRLPARGDRLDLDGNGVIDRSEFIDRPHEVLRFDANGDGAIDRDEMAAAIEQRRQR